jgi:hypothetical protein
VPVCESTSEAITDADEQQHTAVSPVMLAIEVRECNAADNSNALLDFGVLQFVLSYVGPGHHLFGAPVSKLRRDICMLK